jgi:hypothetical protein
MEHVGIVVDDLAAVTATLIAMVRRPSEIPR